MTPEQKRWFRAGYKSGVDDALDRCRCERINVVGPGDKEYNMAITRCISAVKALDVSHSIIRQEAAIKKARPMVEQPDILSKLADLHKQATTERSHYYVASVVRESVVEITSLRLRLGKIAHAPVPPENTIAVILKRWAATNPGEADLPDPYPALRTARALIASHRANDFECYTVGGAAETMDAAERAAIAEYDVVLAQIDEVLNG